MVARIATAACAAVSNGRRKGSTQLSPRKVAAAPLETDVWHGLGEARPGEKLTPSDHVRWASMTKSLSVLYLAWLIDLGRAPRPCCTP